MATRFQSRLMIGGGVVGLLFAAVYAARTTGAQDRRPDAAHPSSIPAVASARPPANAPSPATPSLKVPAGYRAVTLQTTEEIAVAGLVRPGDDVDVQLVLRDDPAASGARGGEARALLENVRVLAIGTAMTNDDPADDRTAEPARTVTLALMPRQVSEFMLARSLGSIYLALRHPGDDLSQPSIARLSDIRTSARPHAAVARREARPASGFRPIEVMIASEHSAIQSGEGL